MTRRRRRVMFTHPPQESRKKLEETVKSETTVARWFNFDGVVGQEMGGAGGIPTRATLDGALNVCLDCINRGPKHVKISKRSKRIIFRYEYEEERSDNKKTWQKIRTEKTQKLIGVAIRLVAADCQVLRSRSRRAQPWRRPTRP